MAMRLGSRDGGVTGGSRTRAAGVLSVYEDFKPLSEWKHEEGADILCLQIPGFMKEQLRIVTEASRGALRVRGERLVAGNKWSRFQEEIPVPEDCDMKEIHAKFEGGILRITMPKKSVPETQSQPIKETKGLQQSPRPAPTKPSLEDLAPNATIPAEAPPVPPIKSAIDRVKSPNSQEYLSRRERKNREEMINMPTLHATGDEKHRESNVVQKVQETNDKLRGLMAPQSSREDQEAINKPNLNANSIERQSEAEVAEKVKETRKKLWDWMMAPERAGKDQEAAIDKPILSAIGDKPSELKFVEKGKETKVPQWARDDQEEALNRPTIDASVEKQREAKFVDKGKETEDKEKLKDLTMAGEVGRKTVQGNMEEEKGKRQVDEKLGSKEEVKGKTNVKLRSLNEGRQLLVNTGVAILVIMGLAAYISHSFGSSSES
ncbi:hypothetical protein Ancab_001115 [Ancistrocladus abbreviatus]